MATESYFRTAKFKVHDPSGRKLRRLKKMQRRYSSAYANVLWSLKGCENETLDDLVSANANVAGDYFAWLISGRPITSAMWDGLVEDVQQSISTYLETPDANFPAPAGQSSKSVEELREALLEATTKEEEDLLKAELKRKDETYIRPINFVRYRNNPIIRSDDGEKLWVAPHLQEREDGKTGALPPNGSSVLDKFTYSTNTHHWREQSNKETLPIECSRWHMHRFFREGTPKSSKVEVKENEIYIHYAFKFEVEVEYDAKKGPMLGIDRGRAITAAYSVVSRDGKVLEQGSSASEKLRSKLRKIDRQIDKAQENGENPRPYWDKRRNVVQDALHRIANQIVETAERHGASICFEDLENLNGGKNLNRRQYSRLMEYVQYKAEAKGIWAEIEVHPAYTSRTCPHCGHHDTDNRGGQKHASLSRDEFECQECGYQAHSDLNAARLIALRGMSNSEGGKEKTGCETLMEFARDRSPARKKDRRKHNSGLSAVESTLS